MADYGRPIEFGISIVPAAATLAETRALARQADAASLDLIGIQDHPYQLRFLDTWALIAALLAETKRIRFFPNVANLPLRGPAMTAKHAASLDVLFNGRFELGLGAGAFWRPSAQWGDRCEHPRRPSRRPLRSFASSGAASDPSASPAATTPSAASTRPSPGSPVRHLGRRLQAADAAPRRPTG